MSKGILPLKPKPIKLVMSHVIPLDYSNMNTFTYKSMII